MSSAVIHSNMTISADTTATAINTVLAAPPVPAQLAQQVEMADGARAIEVAVLFDDAVLEVRHLFGRRENQFSIGSAPGVSFQMDSDRLPVRSFPLVRSSGTDYEIVYTDAMSGELTLNGQSTALHDERLRTQTRPASGLPETVGALALTIPDGARISLHLDNCQFLIRSVPRPRRYPVPLRINWSEQSYTAAVLAGAVGLLGLMFAVPPDPRSLSLDSFSNEQIARYLVKAPEIKEEATPWLKKPEFQHDNSGGKAARGPSGKRGKEDAPRRTDARYAVAGPKNNPDPRLAKQAAAELASTSGILGILHAGKIAGLTSLMGNQSALGNEARDALASIDGAAVTDAWGLNAMGIVGSGHGGNGTGDDTIGLGPWGHLGRNGGPPGSGRPAYTPKLADHRAKAPEWTVGQAEVIGSLDKDLIRRVIRQHMNEVKFCYERELQRDNNLNGRVVVKFSIGGMGSVMSSLVESSTLRSGEADQCIAGAVRRWQFPKPQGGLVIVSYPFVLKAAGE